MSSARQFCALLLWRAMFLRRRRLSIALAALAVGAMLASALLTTYADLDSKMSGEFRRYGANLIVAPATGADTLPSSAVDAADKQGAAVPYLYVIGRADNREVVLSGTDFARLHASPPSWSVAGEWPRDMQECMAGERLGLHAGDRVVVSVGTEKAEWRVTGVVSAGGSADSQLLASLDAVQALAHLPARLSLIEVNAPAPALSAAQQTLASALPDAKVSVLRAVAESTANVMYRVRGLLFASSLVILGIVALSVATTLYAIVIDRRRDIGVMKALGAGEAQIAGLLVTESATLGVIGGVLGCALGLAAAEWIGHAIYQAPVRVEFPVIPEVLLLTVVVAVAATLFPLRVARGVSPAAVLKGE